MSTESKRKISGKKHFSEQVKEIKEAMNKDIEEELAGIGIEEEPDERGDLEKALAELAETRTQCAEYLDKLRQNMADFDNFRKRTAKEKASMFDDGVRSAAEKLIPIMDNFELAVNAATDREDNFFQGVEMILRQMKNAFQDIGIEEIGAMGQPFDPELHNAVAHAADENFGPNEVMEEMRKGYKYKDRVIRHSMVKVAN